MERLITKGTESIEKTNKILNRTYINKQYIKEVEEMIRIEKKQKAMTGEIIL
jgi:hypothetical protein